MRKTIVVDRATGQFRYAANEEAAEFKARQPGEEQRRADRKRLHDANIAAMGQATKANKNVWYAWRIDETWLG